MNDMNTEKKYIDEVESEFQELALKLDSMDFSKDSSKERVYKKVMNSKNNGKSDNMGKKYFGRKLGITAAALTIACTCAVQNVGVRTVLADVLNKVSLGHITVLEADNEDTGKNENNNNNNAKESAYNGPITFDDGEQYIKVDKAPQLYDKSGKEVSQKELDKGGIFYKKDGNKVSVVPKNEVSNENDKLIITDVNKIKEYVCFVVKVPAQLPEGYQFKQAEFNKDNNGNVKDSKYAYLVFENSKTNKEFTISERKDCEETRYTMNSGKVEKIKINGVDAALSDDGMINFAKDGTLYMIQGKDLDRNELIKVAESIK